MIRGVVGPLAAGSADGFREAQERTTGKVTDKIPRGPASYNNDANTGIPGESFQHRRERVTHLLVEVNPLCTTESGDSNSIVYTRRKNIGVHDILLLCDCFKYRYLH